MALYITYKDKNVKEWHVGQQLNIIVNDVVEIQADGDELLQIQYLFAANKESRVSNPGYTIPMPNIRVINWFGDTAKTILAALI